MDLRHLNDSQRAAVECTEGPLLVLAGAGSGKTRVITHRVQHLLELGIPPERVVAVSFTNKAAGEMRERLASMVGGKTAKELALATFHSLGASMLRTEPAGFGLPSARYSILDQGDVFGLIRSLLREIRKRAEVSPPVAKAHGKIFQFQPGPGLFADWALPAVTRLDSGWVTAPGMFSADGPDPASVALAKALPQKMPGRVADLGAGWGYLSFHVLERQGVTECVLVEAEHAALEAARQNLHGGRARFLWEDVTDVERARSPSITSS